MKIHGITITHPDKILFPKASITKLDVVKYYKNIAGQMMPYLKGRPLTLRRFPDSIDKRDSFKKMLRTIFQIL